MKQEYKTLKFKYIFDYTLAIIPISRGTDLMNRLIIYHSCRIFVNNDLTGKAEQNWVKLLLQIRKLTV